MQWIWRLYQRRIININVNIIVAGVLALLPTVVIVHLLTTVTHLPPPEQLTHGQKIFIGAVTFITDIFFDVAIYYGLHWLANHSPWRSHALEEAAKPQFFKDATRVQFERACISPLFYLIALGGQHALMQLHVDAAQATAISFLTAILVTRTIHTFWILWQERAARRLGAGPAGGRA
ncbi:MAG: hypothetical protein SFY95_07275 [Planctomycetota bacterium]|nr:hypothetical protein [Planctomycetota bacterium]